MQIRGWKYRDILRISEMEKECFPEEPWSFTMLVTCFEQESFTGIVSTEEDGEITGYAGITIAADEADIQNIAVSEPYRNSGVGTALLENLLAKAKDKGVKKVFLEVRVSNSAAMSLYLKTGFVGVYARTRYYTDGEDCLVMAKNI
ncbi:MAG: ribosomal protein S18-alanine N-acetyltransferase [Clostridia bacterium]|nr:ribosomal protein S18-alanine N-acetyltransferase [Clostridia bacterium]